jgi:hypothetical protein
MDDDAASGHKSIVPESVVHMEILDFSLIYGKKTSIYIKQCESGAQ